MFISLIINSLQFPLSIRTQNEAPTRAVIIPNLLVHCVLHLDENDRQVRRNYFWFEVSR